MSEVNERAVHIHVDNLTMAYGDFVVMRDLTFTIDNIGNGNDSVTVGVAISDATVVTNVRYVVGGSTYGSLSALNDALAATAITTATPLGAPGPAEGYRLDGHKWFCSAPMCDAFLVLAQASGGLSCFLVPPSPRRGVRW